MKNYLNMTKNRKNSKRLQYKAFILLLLIVCAVTLPVQTTSPKYLILMDIAHNQVFWNDPASMEGMAENQVERVKYMTNQIMKNASSLNAELGYLKEKIKPDDLVNCDLLFIHVPSSKYSQGEIKTIIQYLQDGGSLFLVMDGDYWTNLKKTNVNDIIKPFDIQYG